MLLFIHLFYQGINYLTCRYQSKIYEETYRTILDNNIVPVECGKDISCGKLSPEGLIEIASKSNDDTHKKSMEKFATEFYNKINNSERDIVSYNSLESYDISNLEYSALGVYKKSTNFMLLDFKTPKVVLSQTLKIYNDLTSIAMKMWLMFILFIFVIHNYIKTWIEHEK